MKEGVVFLEWKNLYRGMLMGISDLIPGVSGGTIAFILGIYDRFLEAISKFFSKEWKKHIGFLVPLGLGMGMAILLFSRLIDYLLENHYAPTQFFFMGLIIGVLPLLVKQAEVAAKFTWKHFVALILVALFLVGISMLNPQERDLITGLTVKSAIGLFFAGWLGSMAMLLPGISGSFVLLLLGVYPTVIAAISEMNLPIIIVVGLGVMVGFVVSSKGISYLLKNYVYATYAVIIGLIIGSLFSIFPGIPTGAGLVWSLISLIAGLLVTVGITKYNP